MNVVIVALLSH